MRICIKYFNYIKPCIIFSVLGYYTILTTFFHILFSTKHAQNHLHCLILSLFMHFLRFYCFYLVLCPFLSLKLWLLLKQRLKKIIPSAFTSQGDLYKKFFHQKLFEYKNASRANCLWRESSLQYLAIYCSYLARFCHSPHI